MNDPHLILQSSQKQKGTAHGLVEDVRALRAAEDEQTAGRRSPVAGRRFEEFASDGIAGDRRIFAFEPSPGIGKGDCDRLDERGQGPIGDSGKGVLLVNRRRHSAQSRRDQQWTRGVAAHAEGHVWPVLSNEAPGLSESERQSEDVRRELGQTLPFQSAGGDELERKTRLRHDRLFQTPFRADENDAPIRAARDEFLRDGHGRIDMPPGAATGDHQRLPHTLLAHWSFSNPIVATD